MIEEEHQQGLLGEQRNLNTFYKFYKEPHDATELKIKGQPRLGVENSFRKGAS